MTTAIDKSKESGKAGKPGESTANKGAQHEAPARENLTASDVAQALAREFAEDPATAKAGTEVQPAAGAAETASGEEENEPVVAAEAGAEEPAVEGQEPTAEEAAAAAAAEAQAQAAAAQGGEAELPQELQAAIDTWEEQGRGELPPVLQALVDRRINKLTAKAKAAEEQVAQLNTQLEEARKAPKASGEPIVSLPVSEAETNVRAFARDVEAVRAGTATEQQAEAIRKFLLKNDLEESALAQVERAANLEVAKFDARREVHREETLKTWKAQEAAAEPEAKKYFPWLDDKAAPQYALAQEILAAIPQLHLLTPKHKLALGIHVLGMQAFRKLQAGGAIPAAAAGVKPAAVKVTKAPVRVPAAGAAAPSAARTNGRAAAEEAVRVRFNKNPTRESAVELARMALQG